MIEITPFGDCAALVQLGNDISESMHLKVKQLYVNLKKNSNKNILSITPAYNSITVVYYQASFSAIKEFIEANIPDFSTLTNEPKNIVKIPVCYEVEFAPDLEEVQHYTGLTVRQIIELHTSVDYLVYMLGFTPGFPYLGGLNPKLHMPRKATPRLTIEAGSVGLANNQTGIYPLNSPGGWQIIGKTPLKLFSVNQPFLIEMGDYIQFYSISKSEFENWKNV